MKWLIITFIIIKCVSVTSNLATVVRKDDETSTVSLNNDKFTEMRIEGKKYGSVKTFDMNRTSVYLEDVFYTLKNLDWTEDQVPCLNQTLVLLQNLQNFTLWAVWDWDSISSQPLGLLYGSQYHLGNFDECLDTPWGLRYPELESQYCLADISLERTDKQARKKPLDQNDPFQSALNFIENKSKFDRTINKLVWGMCVPAQCSLRSVERLTGVLLAQTHLAVTGLRANISVNEECQRASLSRPFDRLFYSFIGLFVFFITTTLSCTYIKDKRKNDKKNLTNSILKALDMKTNARNLLKISDDGTQVLYGIKTISICVVALGHQFGMFTGGPISNWYGSEKGFVSVYGGFFLHVDVIVDAFFMMSGFLTAVTFVKIKNFNNPLIIIIRRYLRLIILYALMIFYIAAVYPYMGSGPLWNRAVAAETAPCRQNWWLSLLMISNYVDTENMCIVISWYIPCDFHFFLVAVILYWIYTRYPRFAKMTATAVTIVAIILPGYVTYINKFPPIQSFTYDFITNPRHQRQFHTMYIKSHLRFGPYAVGFFSGFLYARNHLDRFKKTCQRYLTLATYTSVLVMLFCMYCGIMLFWHKNSPIIDAVYAALNRPVWALALSVIVLCCSVGPVPYVKRFLSWYPFVPLSRLTYGVYLIHAMFIERNIFVVRNIQQHDFMILMTLCFGVIFWSYVVSLIIWLVAEAPLNNLITLCIVGFRHKEKEEEKTNEVMQQNEFAQDNGGYLDENLPCSITVISSKI